MEKGPTQLMLTNDTDAAPMSPLPFWIVHVCSAGWVAIATA
jgi:hypothetical protein